MAIDRAAAVSPRAAIATLQPEAARVDVRWAALLIVVAALVIYALLMR